MYYCLFVVLKSLTSSQLLLFSQDFVYQAEYCASLSVTCKVLFYWHGSLCLRKTSGSSGFLLRA